MVAASSYVELTPPLCPFFCGLVLGGFRHSQDGDAPNSHFSASFWPLRNMLVCPLFYVVEGLNTTDSCLLLSLEVLEDYFLIDIF